MRPLLLRAGALTALLFGMPSICSADAGKNDANRSADQNDCSFGKDDTSLQCKIGTLDLSAGLASGGGVGAKLSGSGRIFGLLNTGGDMRKGSCAAAPFSPFLDYATNDSWNSKPGSLNQISLDMKVGVDGALMVGDCAPAPANPAAPTTDQNVHQVSVSGAPKLPSLIGNYGFYGVVRFRYGDFDKNAETDHVGQVLGGGGLYFVFGMLRRPWVDIWPRASVTYYTPISTNSPVNEQFLPAGVKADFVQVELKTGIRLEPFRLVATYDGSKPTTGADQSWENLWNLQLSADIFHSSFKPVVTYQSGKNGGLKYDNQVLIGIAKDLFSNE